MEELNKAKFRRLAIVVALLPAALSAQQVAIGNYSLPTLNSSPWGITSGPDHAMWFSEANGNKIGRIATTGAVTEYGIPTAFSGPQGITTGADGALWFTEFYANQIGRITTAGAVTEYPTVGYSGPSAIAPGPDGSLWFTETTAGRIGKITLSGVLTEYPLTNTLAEPLSIVAGPDGALWFTEYRADKIGRITTSGAITEYLLAMPMGPGGITVGPDEALWFTQCGAAEGGAIGRITTSGAITYYPVPSLAGAGPITLGPGGLLWFQVANLAYASSYNIASMSTTGVLTEYAIPAAYSVNGGTVSDGIAAGPGRGLWFSEAAEGQIGQVVFPLAVLTVSPNIGSCQANLTFTGSGFAPNESVRIYTSGVGSAVLANGTADGTGSFTATATSPQAPYGPRLFLGVGQSSGMLGAATFSTTARLFLNPDAGVPGSTATITGCGFGGSVVNQVKIYWANPRTLLGETTFDPNGTISGSAALTITVPAGAASGSNVLAGQAVFRLRADGARGYGRFTVE